MSKQEGRPAKQRKLLDEAGAGNTLFARQLGSSDYHTREAGLSALQGWLAGKDGSLQEQEALKLWKAVFYCYWHSDKLPVQTALAERLSEIMTKLPEEVGWLYYRTFVRTMRREWAGIDHLRLDKFLMLVRKFFAALLRQLQAHAWQERRVSRAAAFWQDEVLLPSDTLAAAGVAYHLADLLLPELGKCVAEGGPRAAAPDDATLRRLLEPFAAALAATSNPAMVHRLKQGLLEPLVAEVRQPSEAAPLRNLDVPALAAHLFELGAKPETRARSREVLYATSEALERAAAKRQRQQGQQPEQERRPPRKQNHAADEAPQQQQQQEQQEGGQQTPASSKKGKKRRQQEAAEAAAVAATPQQERPQHQVQQPAPAAGEAAQQAPASSSKKQRQATRLGPSPAAAAQLQAAARRQRHAAAAEEEQNQRQQGLRHDITEQEQQLLAAAVAAVTGGGSVTPSASPSKHKKAVRFSLKRNLVNVIGQPPKPEDVRTPPTSKPKGPALKKHSAFGGPASAPERLLTRAGVERLAQFNSWQQQRQGDATPNSAPPAGAGANGLGSSKKKQKQKQRRNSLPAPGSFSRPRASEFF